MSAGLSFSVTALRADNVATQEATLVDEHLGDAGFVEETEPETLELALVIDAIADVLSGHP